MDGQERSYGFFFIFLIEQTFTTKHAIPHKIPKVPSKANVKILSTTNCKYSILTSIRNDHRTYVRF